MKASQVGLPVAASRRKIAGETASPAATAGRDRRAEPRRDPAARRAWVVPGWLFTGLALAASSVLTVDALAWARSTQSGSDAATLGPSALSAAPAQAERAAEQILSYDYADLKQETAAATPYLTPRYAQTFSRTVDDLLASRATAVQGKVTARVMASGVAAAEPGRVRVLLFVDQTSTTRSSTTPQTAMNRVELTMVYQDGRWLVDDVTAL